MKKMLLALLVLGIVTSAGVRSASAQSYPALVNVPFDFIVADRVLPAGSYRITASPEDPTLLMIANTRNTRVAVLAASLPAPTAGAADARVMFKNVDGHMFLVRVAMPASGAREFVVTKPAAEATLARLHLMPEGHADSVK